MKKLFNKYEKTMRKLFDNYSISMKKLFNKYQKTIRKLSKNYSPSQSFKDVCSAPKLYKTIRSRPYKENE